MSLVHIQPTVQKDKVGVGSNRTKFKQEIKKIDKQIFLIVLNLQLGTSIEQEMMIAVKTNHVNDTRFDR